CGTLRYRVRAVVPLPLCDADHLTAVAAPLAGPVQVVHVDGSFDAGDLHRYLCVLQVLLESPRIPHRLAVPTDEDVDGGARPLAPLLAFHDAGVDLRVIQLAAGPAVGDLL